MFSNRLASHLERGVVGFPTTLASSVGLIMASPVILTVTSGFGMGGDTFALAVLLAFIMMQAQVTTFAEAATLIPTTGSVYDYISCGMGRFFAITGALCAYRSSISSPGRRRDDPGGHYGAGELRVD